MPKSSAAPDDYDQLLAALRAEHKPSTATENILVEQLAQYRRLSLRAARLQEQYFSQSRPRQCPDQVLSFYLSYQVQQDRAFHTSLNELQKFRRERERQASGFVSQTPRTGKAQADVQLPAPAKRRKILSRRKFVM